MLANYLNQTCQIINRSMSIDRDEYGDEIPAETTTITTGFIEQRGSSESDDVTETTHFVMFPPTTEIDAGDAVVIEGETFEIIGEPWVVNNPRTGVVSHIQADAKKSNGIGVGS
jgi:hypothetical protein